MQNMKVFQPGRIGKLEIRNRIIVPPMVTNFGDARGFITDKLTAYAEERAKGGVGLFTLEATYVDPAGKGFPFGIGIDNDDKIPGLRRLVDAVHHHGAKISVQLHHAGRETSSTITGSPIVAPSDCPVAYSEEAVHELAAEEIHAIARRFGEAARRAREAGFDMVTIHGAHGYLLSQFLSPYTNKRTDEYGGSLEKRLRISVDVINAIRECAGEDFPLSYRLSVDEPLPGGLSLQEGVQAAAMLSRSGINDIHVVSGNYATPVPIVPPASEGFLTNRARCEAVRAAVGPHFCLTLAGRIKTVYQAEEILQSGAADFAAMGRATIADPEMPARCARGAFHTVRTCIACNEGCLNNVPSTCALNPRVGRESECPIDDRTSTPKKILVVGSGPAGLEAAYLAARRGHRVLLCEREPVIGGQFLLAALPPHKEEIFLYLNNMRNRLAEAGVEIRLSCTVDETFLRQEKPEHVILASGGTPLMIPFDGLDSIPFFSGHDVLRKDLDKLGQRVAVLGGGLVGCETAEYIADTGREVSIVEMLPHLVESMELRSRIKLLKGLEDRQVKLYPGHKILGMENGFVKAAAADGSVAFIGPVDTVVVALGACSEKSLEETLARLRMPFSCAGDCLKPGNVLHATATALNAVWAL